MHYKYFYLLFFAFLIVVNNANAKKGGATNNLAFNYSFTDKLDTVENISQHPFIENTLIPQLKHLTTENKKLTAAILAVTLGMLGVHRIYLGTKPYIPAIYLFTFGGGFFILPAIDLIMIIFSKDINQFENNGKVFMWLKD